MLYLSIYISSLYPRHINKLDHILGISSTVPWIIERTDSVIKHSSEDIILNSIIHFGLFPLGYC